MSGFDWISARSTCTVSGAFKQLEEDVQTDLSDFAKMSGIIYLSATALDARHNIRCRLTGGVLGQPSRRNIKFLPSIIYSV